MLTKNEEKNPRTVGSRLKALPQGRADFWNDFGSRLFAIEALSLCTLTVGHKEGDRHNAVDRPISEPNGMLRTRPRGWNLRSSMRSCRN